MCWLSGAPLGSLAPSTCAGQEVWNIVSVKSGECSCAPTKDTAEQRRHQLVAGRANLPKLADGSLTAPTCTSKGSAPVDPPTVGRQAQRPLQHSSLVWQENGPWDAATVEPGHLHKRAGERASHQMMRCGGSR